MKVSVKVDRKHQRKKRDLLQDGADLFVRCAHIGRVQRAPQRNGNVSRALVVLGHSRPQVLDQDLIILNHKPFVKESGDEVETGTRTS